jgi:hypothetical protein
LDPIYEQRSNYAEPSIGMDEDDQTGKSAKGRARQTVSDKRKLSGPSAKRKKANMNIRTAILYRKNFATLIEESVKWSSCNPRCSAHAIASGSRNYPFLDTHLPNRRRRSSQGTHETSVHRLRVLGQLQVQEMCDAFLQSRLPGCAR